eukprot:GILJ01004426.1.p1 GENE.GILJ01004426.1~~GILJ01004426.1.p1  ORF type:complete len:1009 (-),score=201.47 GILJ01004426.1:141-2768(-)
MTIKLWDWDKGWTNTHVYEGHSHYVMMVVFNPKDSNTFASASLDRTVKVWGLTGGTSPHFTLEGHERGVNCLDYFSGGEKPYLVSGADDKTVKIWDYQTKQCVQTLEGHTNNVSAVMFHPDLPVILSGSEDGTVRIWHSNTYRLETTLNYGMERLWHISCLKGTNNVALGYDEGTIVIKIGNDEPVASMSAGKIIWAKHSEIQTGNLNLTPKEGVTDGERLPLATKDMGSCEIFPQNLKHNSNGRVFAVCGDGEYIIYTAQALRNKSFGPALEFVWATEGGDYATRESTSKVKVFKDFKEHKSFKPSFAAEGIFGGELLSVRSDSFVCFYDWDDCRVIRRIDIAPKSVEWSSDGEFVMIAADDTFYILRYHREAVTAALESGKPLGEDGIEEAFELQYEISDKVVTSLWVDDCFVYTNSFNKLNYSVGGETFTVAHLDRPLYLLGYIPAENRLYLIDKELNVVSFSLLLSVVEYQTAIVRRDFAAAEKVFPSIPKEQHNKVARFLEAQGFKEEALKVADDPEHKFELALGLERLEEAYMIAQEQQTDSKWKQLGDLALHGGLLELAEECLLKAKDLSGLLLLYSSNGDAAGLAEVARLANEAGRTNISFLCFFLLQRIEDCLEVLLRANRVPEAAFLARTYLPSHVSRIVSLWREDLTKVSKRAADSLADPTEYADRFPDLSYGLVLEELFKKRRSNPLGAGQYNTVKELLDVDLIAAMKEIGETDVDALYQAFGFPDSELNHVPASAAHMNHNHHAEPEPVHVAPVSAPQPVQRSPSPVSTPMSPPPAALSPEPIHSPVRHLESSPVPSPSPPSSSPMPPARSPMPPAVDDDLDVDAELELTPKSQPAPMRSPPSKTVPQAEDLGFDMEDDAWT